MGGEIKGETAGGNRGEGMGKGENQGMSSSFRPRTFLNSNQFKTIRGTPCP